MLRDLFFGAVILGLLALPDSAPAQGQFVLELEGSGAASPLQSMESSGNGLRVGVGLDGDPALLEWIQSSFDRLTRRDLLVHALDAKGSVVATQEFYGAFITEVTLPALDASSKEAFALDVAFQAEDVKHRKGDGTAARVSQKAPSALASNFRIEFGDLPCDRVMKIESLGWKRTLAEPRLGSFREQSASKTETSDPKLTIALVDLDGWQKWFEEAVVKGSPREVEGVIEILSPDLRKPLGSVQLEGVVPVGLKTGGMEANKADVATFEVELSVESVGLDLTP